MLFTTIDRRPWPRDRPFN